MSQTKAELIEPQGNVAFDTNTLYVDAGNNRVGIGTTTAFGPLSINNNAAPATSGNINSGLVVHNGNTGTAINLGTNDSGGYSWIKASYINNADIGTNLAFFVGASERARLDTSGRLLVGTSSGRSNFFNSSYSPQFQVETADNLTRAMSVVSSTAGPEGGILILGNQRSGSVGGNTAVIASDELGQFAFQGSDGTEFVTGATISAAVDGTPGANDMPGRLVFSTTADGASSPTERMRITQAGGVRLPDVYNATIALSANVFIDTDGTLKRATSSIKYKTNVETLEDQYADAVLNCRPVWYQSTSGGDNPEWGYWGFIAEEVAEIDPRLVQWKLVEQIINEDGSRETVPLETPEPENVAYDRFVPHLLNLIKRQKEQIEAMEARLSALESA